MSKLLGLVKVTWLNVYFLKAPWYPLKDKMARRSNQSILREMNPEYSLEGLMLRLKLQYLVIPTADSLVKSLILRKIEGRKRGCQRMRWQGVITDAIDMNFSRLRQIVRDKQAPVVAVHGVKNSWTLWGNRAITISFKGMIFAPLNSMSGAHMEGEDLHCEVGTKWECSLTLEQSQASFWAWILTLKEQLRIENA